MKPVLQTLSVCAVLFVSTFACAEEKNDKHVITLPTTTVYGRAQRPVAAVEVTKARMTLGATTPTLAGTMKIEGATKKDPF